MKRILASLILAAVAGPAMSAVVLVDKPLYLGATNWGYTSTAGGQQIAENFTLSAPAKATLVRFFGWFPSTNAATGSFDILFFNSAGAVPATNAFYSFNTGLLTGVFSGIDTDPGGGSIYEWAAAIPEVSFAGPGTYWIAVRDTVSGSNFAWESGLPSGDRTIVSRNTDGGAWVANNTGFPDTDTQALRIEGEFAAAIPEPATLGLAPLAGFIGLWCARRRQRRSAG